MAYQPIIMASVVANEGHGKTEILKTLPRKAGKAAVFHIDPNTEEVFEAAFESGELDRDEWIMHRIKYPTSALAKRDKIKLLAEGEMEKFLDALDDVLQNDDVSGIGFDTATEIFDLHLMEKTGKTVQIMPEMRTGANYKYKGVLRAISQSGKHALLLHRARTRFESKMVTTSQGEEEQRQAIDGVYEREGFSRTGFSVNIEAFVRREIARHEKIARQFGIRFGKCTPRPSLVTDDPTTKEFWDFASDGWQWGTYKVEGERIRRVSFQHIALSAYPSTSLEDWK